MKARAERDLGTPELILHRAAWAKEYGGRSIDPAMTTTPLDVLMAWQVIDAEWYSAAHMLANMGKALFGKVWPKAVDLNMVSGAEVGREADMAQYREAWAAISKSHPLARYECERMIRLEMFPGMGAMDEAENMRRYLSTRGFEALKRGLVALTRWAETARREQAS